MKKFFTILSLLGVTVLAKAQYDPSFSHYMDMETSFNPAAAGKQSQLNITGAYALDFAGYENNPRTMYIAADMPFYALKSYHGVGIQLMNDQIGLFTHQRLGLQYAYRHKLFGGMIAVGIQAGFLMEKFDASKLDTEDSGDQAFATANGNSIDLGAGLYYQHGPWYLGLSATHLTAPTVSLGTNNEIKIVRHYYATGGYTIRFHNPWLSLKPSFLVRTDGTSWREDVTCKLVYTHEKKTMYLGAGYSPNTSVTFLIGGVFHGVMVGYSYEMYTSAINPGNGSHELFVGYQMPVNLVKKGHNRHQSVRIL
ncbi:MAG: type IX secretion system membrane protein PorP/SprF [Prevotellaceae bacterium]|nr:type IX secretion system membrane protein PorP/SprF [Prevotellaceae bacterium]